MIVDVLRLLAQAEGVATGQGPVLGKTLHANTQRHTPQKFLGKLRGQNLPLW